MRVGLRSGQQEAKARGLGVLAHPPHPLRAKQVPPTAFYLNSGLFFSFLLEVKSTALTPWKGWYVYSLGSYCLGEDGICQTLPAHKVPSVLS